MRPPDHPGPSHQKKDTTRPARQALVLPPHIKTFLRLYLDFPGKAETEFREPRHEFASRRPHMVAALARTGARLHSGHKTKAPEAETQDRDTASTMLGGGHFPS